MLGCCFGFSVVFRGASSADSIAVVLGLFTVPCVSIGSILLSSVLFRAGLIVCEGFFRFCLCMVPVVFCFFRGGRFVVCVCLFVISSCVGCWDCVLVCGLGFLHLLQDAAVLSWYVQFVHFQCWSASVVLPLSGCVCSVIDQKGVGPRGAISDRSSSTLWSPTSLLFRLLG